MALDRRSILKFIAGGAVGSILTPMSWKMTDDISIWTQNWPWIPRVPHGHQATAPAVVKLGGPEYGLQIATVDGNPITAQGNPDHPLSRGGIDPLAAASVQLLYSPARVSGPMRRTASGRFQSITWEQGAKLLQEHLARAQKGPDQVACISGDSTGSSYEILASFLRQLNSEAMFFTPSDAGVQTKVWSELMQAQGMLGYDLDRADHLLVLGPDLFSSWGTVVRNQKSFGAQQQDLVYAGPTQNATSAVASSWIPLASSQCGHLALALAYHLLSDTSPASKLEGYAQFASFVRREYAPDKAKRKTGLPLSTIR